MGHGKELFTELSCVQCHRKNGVGGQVGPDLADVRQKLAGGKMTLADVLTEMLEPSKVIDKKYRTEVLVLSSGSLVSGIVMDESEKEVRIRGNPADQKSAEPQTIPLADIIERAPSAVSMMPAGLLNTLTEEEILDLLAYVLLEDK